MAFRHSSERHKGNAPSSLVGPNLFLVGAPKCGTTSMHAYLSQHPEIFMSTPKEPHFFSSDIRFRFRTTHYRNEREYLQLFAGAKDYKRRGEASVWYMYSAVAAENIYRFNPNTLILCMIRNPIDMMFSMYRFSRKKGGENLKTFRDALDAEQDRKLGKRIPKTVFVVESLFYRDIATFSVQIKRYLDRFGRDNVHVIVFDDLCTDPNSVCGEVFSFLGVRDGITVDFGKHNVTDEIGSHVLYRVFRSFPHIAEAVRSVTPRRFRRVILEATNAILPEPVAPESALESQLRIELKKEFLSEVERLSKLLQRDLTSWCR